MENVDAIVIGAGQAGNPLAHNLADEGWQVVLIEREHLGGSCINYGCTPTKAMVASARIAQAVREAGQFGVRAAAPTVDLKAVVQRKDQIVEEWRQGLQNHVDKRPSLELIRGEARFTGPHTIAVGGRTLSADKIFINTGARARVPDLPGLAQVNYLTNKSILQLTTLPEHLLILGGSYIGLEFGQMFRRFGSRVTIVEQGPQLVGREDEDVASALQAALEAEGIQFHLDAHAKSVRLSADEQISLEIENEATGETHTLTGDQLLVGVGRTPNVESLNLEAAGIKQDKYGWIITDEWLETNVPGVYALGDVKGGPAFTHISYNDFQIVYHNLFHDDKQSIADRIVPYALYTEPELGRVGLTEKEARRLGVPLKIGTIPMSYVARAIESGKTQGLMKVIIHAETDRLLGAAVLGSQGGELVQSLMALMLADAPWTVYYKAVFIHPTLTEGFFSLMDAVKRV
jgi:pyruvate/2-oxoglutarate dehydrogenase complex dihydrolipoamide dehydrogenase (E3) component